MEPSLSVGAKVEATAHAAKAVFAREDMTADEAATRLWQ